MSLTRRALAAQAATALAASFAFGAAIDPAGAAAADDFARFLQSRWPDAERAGVSRPSFDALVGNLTPDNTLPRASGGQAEFERPLQAYLHDAVTAGRVAQGRALDAAMAARLADNERRFGVPGSICLAAWGMESDFGRTRGARDILRSLATLAWTRRDRPVFADEFVAALVILDRRHVPRGRLVGSWAGAMGDPQFLPSAYLKYAVSAAADGAPDIWTNRDDIVSSIANFLRAEGWAAGEPWITEVSLPAGFAFPTLHADVAGWTALGLRRADPQAAGRALAGSGEASLFLPSGAAGPAFLLFPNYFAIKQYNNSDSYALSLGVLAQRIMGIAAPHASWPAHVASLRRDDKILIQTRLAALGLYDGATDGKFGPKARDAIHAFQKRAGLQPADGFASPAVLASLKSK